MYIFYDRYEKWKGQAGEHFTVQFWNRDTEGGRNASMSAHRAMADGDGVHAGQRLIDFALLLKVKLTSLRCEKKISTVQREANS